MKHYISLLVLAVVFFSCQNNFKAFAPKRDTVFVAVNYVGNVKQLDQAIVDSTQQWQAKDTVHNTDPELVIKTKIYLGQWVDTVKDSVRRAQYIAAKKPTGYLGFPVMPLDDSLNKYVQVIHLPDNPAPQNRIFTTPKK
jgi:hypothetical protein